MINISLSRAKFNDDADLSSVISHTGQDFKGLTYLLFLQVVEIHKSEISIILRFFYFFYFFKQHLGPAKRAALAEFKRSCNKHPWPVRKRRKKTTALPVR